MTLPYRIATSATGVVAATLPRAFQACPFCDSSISQLVWDGIFTGNIGEHMAMSLAPFAVFAVLGAGYTA